MAKKYESFSAGRIYNIKGILVRAKKNPSCTGCVFDNFISCPNIKPTNVQGFEITPCIECGIIFVKP